MKKSLLFLLVCLWLGSLPAVAGSSVLQPEQDPFAGRHFLHPLECIDLTFDGGIVLLDGAKAEVKCEGATVAVATGFKVSKVLSMFTLRNRIFPKARNISLSWLPDLSPKKLTIRL